MGGFKAIGKSVIRYDGLEKVTGQKKYLPDITLPGMLYGKILRSPHPHAKIICIDVTKAEALPGVRSIIIAKDTPLKKFSFVQAMADKYPLCDKYVRYVGDEVAAVAADDIRTAEKALTLINVEYEVLPTVLDPEAAMDEGSPLVHDDRKNNIAFEAHREFGDLEEGFAQSDFIIENRYETTRVAHCCMETHGCIAEWDRTGKLTIWAPHQAPHSIRQEMARILDIPITNVTIIRTPIGGAFGQRLVTDMKEPIAAILSKRTGRPVKIVNTREDEFMTAKTRYPFIIDMKTGFSKEGKILANQVRVIIDNGAYNDKGPAVANFAARMFSLLYNVPHVKYDAYGVYTNLQFSTAFRGFGGPQIHFAIESQMDKIAKHLDMDPMELRLGNTNMPGDRTKSGAYLGSCGLRECIVAAAENINWKEKRKTSGQSGNKLIGIGMACSVHTGSGGRYYGYAACETFIKISEDGTVTIITPACELGQGVETVVLKVAMEVLGIAQHRIKICDTNTDITPYDLGAWGSRQTFVIGNSVKSAAESAKQELLEVAGQMLQKNPEELDIIDEKIIICGATQTEGVISDLSFEDVVVYSYNKLGMPLGGRGRYFDPEAPKTGTYKEFCRDILAYTFGCQVAEVEVDMETGKVQVIKMVAAQDTGTTINPLICEGQLEGSVMQGIGYALTEQCNNKEGIPQNTSFVDYKVLCAQDIPKTDVILIETNDPFGPFGAKGIGEPGLVPTAAAIRNAIFNATGIFFDKIPIKPDDVLKAIKKKN